MFLISTLTGQFIWNVNFNQEFNLKISGCRNKLKLSIWIHSPLMLNWEIRLCYLRPKISGKESNFGIFGKNSWYELPLTAGKLWNLADKRSVFSTCVTSRGFWTKIFEFGTLIDISDQNQLYHTPLLSKIWDLNDRKKLVNNPFNCSDLPLEIDAVLPPGHQLKGIVHNFSIFGQISYIE